MKSGAIYLHPGCSLVHLRTALRWLAAGSFVAAGANHFVNPDFYRRIIPPRFPDPPLLVVLRGLCEIAGGLGLLVPRLRRPAGFGLIALLLAVFPANIYMAVSPEHLKDLHVPCWINLPLPLLLWLRLPLQAVFILWVWFVSLGAQKKTGFVGTTALQSRDCKGAVCIDSTRTARSRSRL